MIFSVRKSCSYVRHLRNMVFEPVNQKWCVDFIYVLRSEMGKGF